MSEHAPRRMTARLAVVGGALAALALVGAGSAFADEEGTPGTLHGLVSTAPVTELTEPLNLAPVDAANEHLEMEHTVPLGDYVAENAQDPVGYSVGSHVDMIQDMTGTQGGSIDALQEQLGATPDEEH
jgi:hypothetical protein